MIKTHNSLFFLSLCLIISLFIIKANPFFIFPVFLVFLLFKARLSFYLLLIFILIYSNSFFINDSKHIESLDYKHVVLNKIKLVERQGNKFLMESDFGMLLVSTGKDFQPEFGKIYKQVPCILQKNEFTSNFFCFKYSNYLLSKKVFLVHISIRLLYLIKYLV